MTIIEKTDFLFKTAKPVFKGFFLEIVEQITGALRVDIRQRKCFTHKCDT